MRFLTCFCFLAAVETRLLAGAVVPELLVDGEMNGALWPGEPSEFELSYYYMATGEPVTEFMIMHGKLMHMVVISKDLRDFAHLHPHFDSDAHVFRMTINQPADEPDNFQAQSVLTRSGEYYVFTEVMIHEPRMMIVEGEHSVLGLGSVESNPLPEVEYLPGAEPLVKYYDERGDAGQIGAKYRISFWHESHADEGQTQWQVFFELREKKDDTYVALEGLENWLTMGGHVMMLSFAGERVGAKTFRHMHTPLPENLADPIAFVSDTMHATIPNGDYKLWAQFKDRGQVLTFDVTLRK
jgi:hypothetical protein